MGYKKVLLLALIICVTLFSVSKQGWAVQQPFQEFISIEQALDFVGCDREYLNVNGWCLLKKGYMPFSDLKALAVQAASFFGLEGYSFSHSQDNSIRRINIRGISKNGQVVSITCQSIRASAEGDEHENYMVVDIMDGTHKADSRAVRSLLEEFFNTIGVNVTITVTLVGSLEGQLEPSDMRSICNGVLKHIQARTVEGLYQKGFISLSGYSPALGKGIMSGGRPVNIQVALRYNSYKGRTYIWVGTPIINVEY